MTYRQFSRTSNFYNKNKVSRGGLIQASPSTDLICERGCMLLFLVIFAGMRENSPYWKHLFAISIFSRMIFRFKS
jgi:hypothetical protein